MKSIINIFLFLLMACAVNAQSVVDNAQSEDLNVISEQSTMATLEQIVLQTVGRSTTLHPDPSGFLSTLPLKTQEDFRSCTLAMRLAQDLLPAHIQKLEHSLDKLGVSDGFKYYFLYCFLRKFIDERAWKMSTCFLKKSAETYFPQAIVEWAEEVIVSKLYS